MPSLVRRKQLLARRSRCFRKQARALQFKSLLFRQRLNPKCAAMSLMPAPLVICCHNCSLGISSTEATKGTCISAGPGLLHG